ncbi:MAG TPA: 6-carboxytetrahydropterin synthase [Phycisphaerales bacterium]|nr:6-carboxytetrahydropterin synthase [Phycisphaerales bacterium]HRQ75370.1 6-carboxytetrahydropterin synthase [Phycisphaerales bacterium]
MFELSIKREFCAAHAIMLKGEREPLHGHNWHVTVIVTGETLDADGLLCDFHELERTLDSIIQPLNNRNLNETPPFDRVNPTAELVAKHIADRMKAALPTGVRLLSARVTEAPGCAATWREL